MRLLMWLALAFVLLVGACSSDEAPGDAAPTAWTPTPGGVSRALADHLVEAASEGFSGTVLVAKDGEVLLHEGYGECVREESVPCRSDTVYDIGSITKVFTATAVMALAERGELSVDDQLSTFFPEAPEAKASITIQQLLTHTAGFAETLGGDYDRVGRDEFLELLFGMALAYEPGAGYGYSNVGYSVLGAVLEVVAGVSYEDVLRETVLAPADMDATGYVVPDWQSREIAHGYTGDVAFGSPFDHPWADDGPFWHLRANGGLLSAADDLLSFHEALLGDGLLTQDALAEMYEPRADDQGLGRGYGWGVEDTRHGRVVRHNGGNGYFFADLVRYLDEGIVVIVLSNNWDYANVFGLGEALGDIVLGIGAE